MSGPVQRPVCPHCGPTAIDLDRGECLRCGAKAQVPDGFDPSSQGLADALDALAEGTRLACPCCADTGVPGYGFSLLASEDVCHECGRRAA